MRLIASLHGRVQVKFTVNEITHEIECTIGVKQGDVLGPILFTFFLAAVMITWRANHDRLLCLFRTKMDDVLTGRRVEKSFQYLIQNMLITQLSCLQPGNA